MTLNRLIHARCGIDMLSHDGALAISAPVSVSSLRRYDDVGVAFYVAVNTIEFLDRVLLSGHDI